MNIIGRIGKAVVDNRCYRVFISSTIFFKYNLTYAMHHYIIVIRKGMLTIVIVFFVMKFLIPNYGIIGIWPNVWVD